MEWKDFREEMKEEVRVRELLLLLVVPCVLGLIFLLPGRIQSGLMLEYQDPTVFNLLSTAYVHRDLPHLATNSVMYLCIVFPAYLFSVVSRARKVFWSTFFGFLFVLPFVLSVVNLAVLDAETGAGFSGVVGAFLGLLPITVFLFINRRVSDAIEVTHGVTLFVLVASIISWTYSGMSRTTVSTLVAAIALTAFYVYRIGLADVREAVHDFFDYRGYAELVIASLGFFLIFSLGLFPSDISSSNGTVNIWTHYVGFTLGFFLPYIYLSKPGSTRSQPPDHDIQA